MPKLEQPNRDSVTTIRTDGSRPFLFPADVRGRFARARKISAFGLIAFYFALPWIKINGYPAVFLNIAERRFHLFGLTLAAQDLWLMFFVITGLGFSLFFVTALLGRVWCGWACPHTVFLDHVFRQIERWIDGDSFKRRQLDAAGLSGSKVAKRVAKHALFILASAVITHLFLAYFVSLPEVWGMVRAAPAENWSAFGFIVIATGLLYFNFAWFREQMCTVICPYGRMQSALIDDNSLVIGYDYRRGEPRRGGKGQGAGDRGQETLVYSYRAGVDALPPVPSPVSGPRSAEQGDCVACNRCVQVCPAGIDIRQGLQMECIGCTACIDACDEIMTRVKRPTGLIRYDSQNAFSGKSTRWLRARVWLYFVLLMVGASVTAWALSTVKPATLAITRMTGTPYVVDDATVRNQFLVRLVNKRNQPAHFRVQLAHTPADVRQVGFDAVVEVAPLAEIVQPLILQQPRPSYQGPFNFQVRAEDVDGKVELVREAEFLGPEARLLREEEEEKRGHR